MSSTSDKTTSTKSGTRDVMGSTVIQIPDKDTERNYDTFNTKEIEVVDVENSEYKIPLEVEIVKVTPPKRKRTKVGKDGVKRREILVKSAKNTIVPTTKNKTTTSSEGKEAVEESDEESAVDYLVIKTLSCNNGSNVLTRIPGGYIEHLKCPIYIEMLHRSLYYEVKVWCEAITDFVDNIEKRLEGTVYDCDWEPEQGQHIKKFVKQMEKVVRNKILKKRSIVMHSLNYGGIMQALPGCDKEMAKIVYNMCRSATYHVRFMVMMGPDGVTYDIGTLFSIGVEWSFGQWDNRTLFLTKVRTNEQN